jgi:hypothetical protein
MRTTFFASTLLTLLACIAPAALQAQETVVSPAGTSIRYSARNSKTRFVIRNRARKYYSLLVSRDSTVARGAAPSSVEVLGEIPGSLMIITDTYPSIPGGMSYCQAGEERFLRVISFATKHPIETVKLKIESCRDSLELASEGIEWQPQFLSLRVNWLTGPAASGAPESRTINLTRQGRPR